MIIADITRVYQNTEGQFVRTFQQRLGSTGSRGAIVIHERQRRALLVPPEVGTIVVGDLASAFEIAAAIREQALLPTLRNSAEEPLEVFSFHRPVIELSGTLPEDVRHRTRTMHWNQLREGGVLQNLTHERRSATVPPVPVPDKAITAVLEILSQYPRGLGITALREFLVAQHPDLAKAAGGPPVKTILMPLRDRGLISVEPPDDVNPWICLTQHQQDADASRSNATATSTSRVGGASADISRQGAPAEPVQDAPSTTSKEAEKEKKKKRLKQLHDHLAKNHFGPFSDDRTAFFDEISRLVEENKHSAMKLLRKAARKVVEERKLRYPWSAVEEFLFNLFDRRRVLLDRDGTPRSPKELTSAAFAITHLIANWRDLVEMEMVLRLAEIDCRIHRRELDRLAFLLFPQMEDEVAYDRLDYLLAMAASEDRARFVDDFLVVSQIPTRTATGITLLPSVKSSEEGVSSSPAA